jgi:hypothetical protein
MCWPKRVGSPRPRRVEHPRSCHLARRSVFSHVGEILPHPDHCGGTGSSGPISTSPCGAGSVCCCSCNRRWPSSQRQDHSAQWCPDHREDLAGGQLRRKGIRLVGTVGNSY